MATLTTGYEKQFYDFDEKLLLSLTKLELTPRWIPQPENTQIECTFAYDGAGKND